MSSAQCNYYVLCAQLDSMLDLSKLEAGKLVLREEEIDLKIMLEELCSILSPMKAPGVELQQVIMGEEKQKQRIVGDLQRWMQLLINLTSNALKVTKRGFVRIEMRLTSAPDWSNTKGDVPNIMADVRVMDTGPGIDPAQKYRLFRKYEQVNLSSGGCGLGLVIAQKIAGLWNSSIEVESPWQADTAGSMFSFRVACRCAARAPGPRLQTMSSNASHDKDKESLKQARILLVEDDQFNALLLRGKLEKSTELAEFSFQVSHITSAEEAVALLRQDPGAFEIIIMDEHFATGSGDSSLRGSEAIHLLRHELECNALIISCSGNCLADNKVCYTKAGADLCWPKPYPSSAKIRSDLLLGAAARRKGSA